MLDCQGTACAPIEGSENNTGNTGDHVIWMAWLVGWTSVLRHTLLPVSGQSSLAILSSKSKDKGRLLLSLAHCLREGGQMSPNQARPNATYLIKSLQ